MSGSNQERAPRGAKIALNAGIALLGALGLALWLLLGMTDLGIAVLALGGILLALRGYLSTGDKAIAGVLIFVCVVVIGMQIISYFLSP